MQSDQFLVVLSSAVFKTVGARGRAGWFVIEQFLLWTAFLYHINDVPERFQAFVLSFLLVLVSHGGMWWVHDFFSACSHLFTRPLIKSTKRRWKLFAEVDATVVYHD